MQKIIKNNFRHKTIRLNTNDIISIVKEYQNIACDITSYEMIRKKLDKLDFYLFEDMS